MSTWREILWSVRLVVVELTDGLNTRHQLRRFQLTKDFGDKLEKMAMYLNKKLEILLLCPQNPSRYRRSFCPSLLTWSSCQWLSDKDLPQEKVWNIVLVTFLARKLYIVWWRILDEQIQKAVVQEHRDLIILPIGPRIEQHSSRRWRLEQFLRNIDFHSFSTRNLICTCSTCDTLVCASTCTFGSSPSTSTAVCSAKSNGQCFFPVQLTDFTPLSFEVCVRAVALKRV